MNHSSQAVLDVPVEPGADTRGREESRLSGEPQDAGTPARWPTAATALWAVLLAANIAPIWFVHYFPAQNGPWFLSTVHVFNEIDNPAYGYSEFYERNWFPIPHMLFHAVVLLLDLALPLLVAEKLALSVSIALVPLSVLYFLSIAAPHRKMFALLAFLMMYSYPFMRGYNNYSLSVPVFFFTFGYWLKTRDTHGARKYAVLAVLSVLLYLSHLIAFLLLCCTIGWYQLRKGTGWIRATTSTLAATAAGWPLVIAYLVLNNQSSQWIKREDTAWQPFHWTIQYFVEKYFMTVSVPAYVISVAAWLWVPFLLILSARKDSSGFWTGVRRIALSPLGSLGLVLLLSFLALPDHIIGWHKFNLRFIPFVLVVMLAVAAGAISVETYRRLTKPFVLSVSLASLLVPLFIGRELTAMDSTIQSYTSAVDLVEPRSKVLPLLQENPKFGSIYPLTRAHEYYLIERGGGNGSGIAQMNTLSMVWYRHYPVSDVFPRYEPDMSDAELKEMLQQYDYVLIWGGDQAVDQRLKNAAMKPVHDDEQLRLYTRG